MGNTGYGRSVCFTPTVLAGGAPEQRMGACLAVSSLTGHVELTRWGMTKLKRKQCILK
jgi:hypothetical protein